VEIYDYIISQARYLLIVNPDFDMASKHHHIKSFGATDKAGRRRIVELNGLELGSSTSDSRLDW